MDFEQELKRALGRQQPPAGFAQRVMARVERRRPSPASYRIGPRWAQWAVAASLIVASATGTSWYRQRQERARAEEARQQILLAMRVTAEKIGHVQQTIKRISLEEN
ncbi:MAG: hypothetical protein HY858_13450 [Candidatus Solibacter usitatus]|nr:hypothetical protein [Candidatus Solibacter usitatus]